MTNNILTEDHVAMDSLKVVTGKVMDETSLLTYVNIVPISDIEIPSLVSATTLDVNADGYIDNIKLVFSEEIRDANVNNYASANDSLVAIPLAAFTPRWAVEGYTVIGVNFTTSNAAATLATTLAGGKKVYNVNDVDDDEILYLAIQQGATYDTKATPKVTMSGGAGGSGVSDYSPNYVPSFSVYPDDGAGVVLVDADMTSTTTLEIVLSESINTDTAYLDALTAGGTIVWLVGTEKVPWQGNVVNISFPTVFGQFGKTRIVYEVAENSALVPDMDGVVGSGWKSTVALVAGGLQDNNDNVTNVATVTPLNVTPAPEVVTVESELPDAFALEANYPNPFNPTTTIGYAIPAVGAGHVELVVYNMNGQKVRTLVSETQEAGYYNVVWDGRNDTGELVSSGIYLYQIVSGSFHQIEKMTFIK
jgi:hypothetical protein